MADDEVRGKIQEHLRQLRELHQIQQCEQCGCDQYSHKYFFLLFIHKFSSSHRFKNALEGAFSH